MTVIYFSNCLPVSVTVLLNGDDTTTGVVIAGRTVTDEATTLTMHGFPTGQAVAPGVFGLADSNSVQVVVDDPLGTSFEIEVDSDARELDLYFFVFRTTLVGQRSDGAPQGITIRAHEAVKKVIQTGAPPVTLPVPPQDTSVTVEAKVDPAP